MPPNALPKTRTSQPRLIPLTPAFSPFTRRRTSQLSPSTAFFARLLRCSPPSTSLPLSFLHFGQISFDFSWVSLILQNGGPGIVGWLSVGVLGIGGQGLPIWLIGYVACVVDLPFGFTVERIVAGNWPILDESESDWKSHAAAIAQSIHLIKRRMKKLVLRLDLLSRELNKPDIWDDPMHAGKISHEHGSLMGKMKEVRAFERELLEHIDMVKLAREEDDAEMESESLKALLRMRRNSKEKELQALLSGELDSCSCYIEDSTFEFERKRNRPERYDRNLTENTLKA
ncbi:Peptide chain release factor 2 [Morella rubra]|uniref:Peptide chain release factor 2 n=1 Tax=Morella rubra TaxID=262757 RepID=A0A6A1WM17_9ROSI|nr:Peptide chain release factor 2 [Morella rubra]